MSPTNTPACTAIPAGFVLVPTEPTLEMIAAGQSHTERGDEDFMAGDTRNYRARGEALAVYFDMLSAAPVAPAVPEGDKLDAARYRRLRSQSWNVSAMCVVELPKTSVKLGYDCPSLLRLDAAIDAAMQATGATS